MSGDWGDWLLKLRNKHVVPFLSNTGLLCCIFLFMMRQMFSIGWKIWPEGWPCQYPDPSCTQPWCCKWCSVWFGIGMLENARDDVWIGAYVVVELGLTFQHWWCLSRWVSGLCSPTVFHRLSHFQPNPTDFRPQKIDLEEPGPYRLSTSCTFSSSFFSFPMIKTQEKWNEACGKGNNNIYSRILP